MIEHDAKQGTADWICARLGIPTASEFARIITPVKAEPSRQAETYMCKLIGEWLSGEPEDSYTSDAMARGFMMQPQALDWYGVQRDTDVRECGLCYLDERRLVGASPDGFVGDDVSVEVKCPLYAAHVRTLITETLPDDYRPQVQGQLWVTERTVCHFVSYHPALPSVLLEVERDEEYIAKLSTTISAFVDHMLTIRDQLQALGHEPRRATPKSGADTGGEA